MVSISYSDLIYAMTNSHRYVENLGQCSNSLITERDWPTRSWISRNKNRPSWSLELSDIISFITHVSLLPPLFLNCSLVALSAKALELNEWRRMVNGLHRPSWAQEPNHQAHSYKVEPQKWPISRATKHWLSHNSHPTDCWLICVDKRTRVQHNQNLMVGIVPWLLEGFCFIC